MRQKKVKAATKPGKKEKFTSKMEPPKKVEKISEASDDEELEMAHGRKNTKVPVSKKAARGKKVAQESDGENEEVIKNVVAKKPEQKQGKARKVKEDDDDEEEVKTLVARKPIKKRGAIGKKVVVVEPEEEEEEMADDDDQEEQEEQDEGDENDGNDVEYDEEDSDEDEDNDEDQDDDEDEDNNEDGDNDEAEDNDEDGDNEECEHTDEEEDNPPPNVRASPSQVLTGPLKFDYAPSQCIHVTKLPKTCKQIDVIEAFAKYGVIRQIHIGSVNNGIFADIAFKTPKAAAAAIADNGEIQVNNVLVRVVKRDPISAVKKQTPGYDRSIHVRNISVETTEGQIRELFETCGEIESLKMSIAKDGETLVAFIKFTKMAALQEALKLQYTVLNNSNIRVFAYNVYNEKNQYHEDLTIMLRNKQDLKSIEMSKLKSIFSKCGEIDYVEIICKRNVLAFITFKTKEAAEKALKMSGETAEDVALDIEAYSPLKKWTSIHVVNVPKGCTEADLRTHFAKAGKIENVTLKGAFVVIRFEDSDGFCKSFLYNESFIKGHMIFIEPYSQRKVKLLHKKFHLNKKKGVKRSFENGKRSFNAKRAKLSE